MNHNEQLQLKVFEETSTSSDGNNSSFLFSCIQHSPLREFFEGIYCHYRALEKNNDNLKQLSTQQAKKIEGLEAEYHTQLRLSNEKEENIRIITSEAKRLQRELERSNDHNQSLLRRLESVTFERDELVDTQTDILVGLDRAKNTNKSSVTLNESERMRESEPEMNENMNIDDGIVLSPPKTSRPPTPKIKITNMSYANPPKSHSATTATTTVKFEVEEEPLMDEEINSEEFPSYSAPNSTSTNANNHFAGERPRRSHNPPLRFSWSLEPPLTKKKRTSNVDVHASTENENLRALEMHTEAAVSSDNLTADTIPNAKPTTRKGRKCRKQI